MSVVVVGVDPGLAQCGVAALRVDTNGSMTAIGALRIATKPSAKKHRIRAVDDCSRRVGELRDALDGFFAEHRPAVVSAEALSYPRNASSAVKLGMAVATVQAAARHCGAALIQHTPRDLRRALQLPAGAAKTETCAAACVRVDRLAAVLRRWGVIYVRGAVELPGQSEHVADAAVAAVAGARCEIVVAVLAAQCRAEDSEDAVTANARLQEIAAYPERVVAGDALERRLDALSR